MAQKGTILVCGGAGYIGSHMCRQLFRAGYQPVVFDNFSTGHRWAVKWGPSIDGDLLDVDALSKAFTRHRFDAVLHFAAKALVAESTREPGLYFQNNVSGTINLLEAMRAASVHRLVFSSSCAVYGDPIRIPMDEAHPTVPVNPYGWSKLLAERVIREQVTAHGLRAVSLRYFNVAGASDDRELGEQHDPETHLIPNLIRAAIDPSLGPVNLFGDDFDTADGSCVRDYIHVEDLCEAHLLALQRLDSREGFEAFNLGTGTGHSVSQVVEACRNAHGGKPETVQRGRRPGDPSALVASPDAARQALGWEPRRGLAEIIASASAWHGRSGAD